jgi:hypothetical protein
MTQAASGTTTKPETKPVGGVNAIEEAKGNGFWMVTKGESSTHAIGTDPDPFPYDSDECSDNSYDSDNELELGDWLCEADKTITATISAEQDDAPARIKLYDLGVTWHISPYKDDFTTYSLLSPPVLLSTANQQRFQAIGAGALIINVPNEGGGTSLTLNNALHAPSVSYTLVSLGTLDAEGYAMKIGGGQLTTASPQGQHVGAIACTAWHLYHVTHKPESANTTQTISIMELHCRLGHIAPDSARKLVESGAITGIKLDPVSEMGDCDACIYAQSTRLPIMKLRLRPPAQSFREGICHEQ